ncbi:MAG: hypothetical protein NC346_01395 [Prevotella sp.]|nr:hypothetical protein [Bacteroidales bacterium]MCM1068533.1 hypothetical protein [Prevotella sp.]MCM1402630.1 hypothetical protein [Bacteroides sp.]MCM1442395.1 hypothetical protein [Muribaculum sp.]MCM1575368.1 hypothetical protein [Bacteroides sp.]
MQNYRKSEISQSPSVGISQKDQKHSQTDLLTYYIVGEVRTFVTLRIGYEVMRGQYPIVNYDKNLLVELNF